jgi:acyl-CoA synthetase (AMP-forming)/AMP-acid ligase II
MAFTEIFRLHARLRPTKPALIEGERTITFRELDRRINGACFALADAGFARDDIVGVALRDTAEHLLMLLALARLGATIVPMDCRWSARETLSVAHHFRVARVLVERGEAVADPSWLAPDVAWCDESDGVYADPAVTLDSPLLLSLSSGTTGIPKGPRVSHRQFESRFMIYWINLGFTAQDRFVSSTPLYFGGGRAFALSMLYAGATVDLFPPPFRTEALIARVAAFQGTAMFLVPTMMRRLLQDDFPGLAFPSLRKLVSSGSALFLEERRAIRARLSPHLYELYSSTEGGAVSVLAPEEFELHPDSVGRPCFRVEVEVVDGEHRALPAGDVGRLRYRSPASSREYFVGDGSEAFHDGWYYPGDLAALDAEGFVFLRGRAKDMIIRGGVNIYPGDIEQILLQVEGVTEAAVVGMKSAELGEEVVAFVTANRPFDEAALIAHCRGGLAPYKVPKQIHLVDTMPKSSVGKILKTELAKRLPSV